jgi:hypothetical protein
MIWISFHGPRRPINGQNIYYYSEHFGVRKGKYVYSPNDPYSPHMIHSTECAGFCDRMDAPWWMPDDGQERPVKPSKDYPDDYPRLISVNGREVWTTEGRIGFYEE